MVIIMFDISSCKLCPRRCGTDRSTGSGFCGATDKIKIARAGLHFWEEPCISGENGSGTVFFSGCTMKCAYCQNYEISHENFGKTVTAQRLAEIFYELQEKGAHNINLVTPTHYLPWIAEALEIAKPKVPVVYNCGGYENPETIREYGKYFDIFLTDIKYYSDELSAKYSKAPDYFRFALESAREMAEITGEPVFEDGIMKRGTIIRHLVLPGHRQDSIEVLRHIDIPKEKFILSLMSQFTPKGEAEKVGLGRRITTFEYNSVVDEALRLGFDTGYMQEKSSANEEFIPPFDLTGV